MSTTPLSTTEVRGAVVAGVVERGRVVVGARAGAVPPVDVCGAELFGVVDDVVDDVVDINSAEVEVLSISASAPALSVSEEGV
jgi:hypothetical protein